MTVVIACLKCSQNLRIPTDNGNLVVHCPICRHSWDWMPAFQGASESIVEQGESAITSADMEAPSMNSQTEEKPPLQGYFTTADEALQFWIKELANIQLGKPSRWIESFVRDRISELSGFDKSDYTQHFIAGDIAD